MNEPPPAVSLRQPPPDAADQSPDSRVVLGFSKPISDDYDPTGLAQVSFDGVPVEGSVTVSGSQIEFQPTDPLALERSHDVQWSGAVSFTTGESLDVDESWSFEVATGAWREPELVLTFSSIIDSAVSDSGRAASVSSGELVSSGGAGTVSSLFSSIQGPDGNWLAPLPLAIGDGIARPRLIWSQDSETLFAAWHQGDLRAARVRPDGSGVWENLPDIPAPVQNPRWLRTTNGTMLLAYQNGNTMRFQRLLANGQWSGSMPVGDSTGGVSETLAVGSTPSGDPVVSWLNDARDAARFVVFDENGTPGPTREISLVGMGIFTSFAQLPVVVLDDVGGALLMARSSGPIFATYLDAIDQPGPVYDVTEGQSVGGEFSTFDAAYVDGGMFAMLFRGRDLTESSPSVYAVTWRASAGGPPSERMALTDESDAPTIGFRGYQRVSIVSRPPFGAVGTWLIEQNDNGDPSGALQSRRFRPESGWEPLRDISTGIFGCPALPGPSSISDRGTQVILWTEVSQCGVGSGKSGPPSSSLYGLSADFR